ncbi:MAG: SLC13 family permease [Pirellula sp.]|jgi:di/tricarboxylate transporter
MPLELGLVLLVLFVAIVMFAIDKPRMDFVALLVICVLPLTGVIDVKESLIGFGDPNVVLIAAMFVIGEGLVRTGVTRHIGDWLVATSGSSTNRLIVLLMVSVCLLGSTMSSTAVTALFIPIVLRICRRTGIPVSQLMMPLSMAALISGMTTLVATAPNMVVNAELVRRGEKGFEFFSFTPFGLPVLVMGILYMLAVKKWLPKGNGTLASRNSNRPTLKQWVEKYHLAGREHRLLVKPESSLVGRRIETCNLREDAGANLVAIQRDRELLHPTAKSEIQAGDILLLDLFSRDSDIESMADKYHLVVLPLTGAHFTDRTQEIGMAELIVSADSDLVGKTIIQSGFRSRYGVSVIGLRRGVKSVQSELKHEVFRVGDTLLVIGPWKSIRTAISQGGRDLVPLHLPQEFEELIPEPGRVWQAILILFVVISLMVSGVISNVQAALIGCILMGAFGCIDFDSAYRSIDWKTIVLIVGMLPFPIALSRTGGVEIASVAITSITSGFGLFGVLMVIFLATSLLGLFISNTATAVLMAPIALSVAERLEISPYPFAMVVALAASTAFMTPVSSPVNTLVMTPGGYRFMDFVRFGVPFSILVMTVIVCLVVFLMA